MRSDEEILADLESAAAGLLVMSESDYAFETLMWQGRIAITPEFLRTVSGSGETSAIEETDLDTFLAGEEFRNLAAALKRNLSDLKVYKVGAISIPVYIVGRSPQGSWLGLSTRLIQT